MLSKKKLYFVIFTLSFLILTLQLILSSLLRVYLHLPFFSISFAFLGLSSAGVYAFFRSSQKDTAPSPKYLAQAITVFGLINLLFFSVIFPVQQQYRSITINKLLADNNMESTNALKFFLIDIMKNSLFMGVCFSVCFFFIGLAVSYIYRNYTEQAPRIYLMDLSGAALGGMIGTWIMTAVKFSSIPLILSGAAFLLALSLLPREKGNRVARASVIFLFLLTGWCYFANARSGFMDLRLSHNSSIKDYEGNAKTKEIWSGWNAYSRLGLIRYKRETDLRDQYLFEIDHNMGLAHMSPFTSSNLQSFVLFEKFTPVALAFMLDRPKDLLIMFAGAGQDMLEAYAYSNGQADITGVEINPMIVTQAARFPGFRLDEFFNLGNIHMMVMEGRNFLESSGKKYDAIIYSWAGASFANYLGISGYTGQYLFTKEAFISLLNHLKENGIIGIVNNNKVRVVGLAKSAYEAAGDRAFAGKIIIFDKKENLDEPVTTRQILTEIDTIKILMKKSLFTAGEIDKIKESLGKMGYGLIYAPGYIHPNYTIFRDVIDSADAGAELVRLSRENFIDQTLSTDNKPFIANIFYFPSVFKKAFWDSFRKNDVVTYSVHYYLNALILLFIVSIGVIGVLFILLPFAARRKDLRCDRDLGFLYYFSALGLGFIFIEIATMNQFVLFLGNPIYSFSVILAGLLLATGLGSYVSNGLFERGVLNIRTMALITSGLLVTYYFLVPRVVSQLLGAGFMVKILAVFALLIPLGTCLGMFFPQGLKKLNTVNRHLIPWVWGLNGYMSIVGSSVSIYLSTMLGFNMFIILAACIYLSFIFLPDELKS